MRTQGRRNGLLGVGLAAILMATMWVGSSWAATIVVDGIKVTYPYGFDAYYDSSDNTLTIQIFEEGGSLSVKALSWAPNYWGGYADVYVWANCWYVPSMSFKGLWNFNLYITGQVGETNKLTIKNGFVGGTDYYGTQGLGQGYLNIPSSISIKSGCAYGSVLGEQLLPCP